VRLAFGRKNQGKACCFVTLGDVINPRQLAFNFNSRVMYGRGRSSIKALWSKVLIRLTIPDAMRDIMTAEVNHIMMGMSAETFWGGLAGNDEFSARLREHMPDEMGLTTGADAIASALAQFNVKNISVVSPYQPIGDEQVQKFFSETGYSVKRNIGLRCDTANSIAHTPQKDVLDVVLNELDGDDVDAIVQVGTNMSNSDLFPTIEKMLGKPVIPINVATIWHALRAIGVNDKFVGKGWLMERH
jgi:maleate isomerase